VSRDQVLARVPELRTELGLDLRRSVEVVETRVDVQPLDDLRLAPDFIKVDVQGWETQVLRGLETTIGRHQPLVMVEGIQSPRGPGVEETHGAGQEIPSVRRQRSIMLPQRASIRRVFQTTTEKAHVATNMPTTA
jgi:Methyltransferase FkbM domain